MTHRTVLESTAGKHLRSQFDCNNVFPAMVYTVTSSVPLHFLINALASMMVAARQLQSDALVGLCSADTSRAMPAAFLAKS